MLMWSGNRSRPNFSPTRTARVKNQAQPNMYSATLGVDPLRTKSIELSYALTRVSLETTKPEKIRDAKIYLLFKII